MKLNVLKSNEEIAQIDLSKEVEGQAGPLAFFIGRDKECHVVLEDRQVSRNHAKLVFQNGIWTIQRLSSLSPLLVGGNATQERDLLDGDVIYIGPFSINVNLNSRSNAKIALNEKVVQENASLGAKVLGISEAKDLGQTQTFDKLPSGTAEMVHQFDNQNHQMNLENQDGQVRNGQEDNQNNKDAFQYPTDHFEDLSSSHQGEGIIHLNHPENNDVVNSNGLNSNALNNNAFSQGEGDQFSSDPLSEGASSNSSQETALFKVDSSDSNLENEGVDFSSGDVVAIAEDGTAVMKSFLRFELSIFGEYAPYEKYTINPGEILIGRDHTKCQIVLNDPEVSSIHARIKRTNATCLLEDLKSANGTLLNGVRTNQAELSNRDEFIIGSTTFTMKIFSDLLGQEKDRLMPVEMNQVIEVEEVVDASLEFGDGEGLAEGGNFGDAQNIIKPKSLFSKEALKDPKQRKKLIYIVCGFLLLIMMLSPTEKETRDLASIKSQDQAPALQKQEKQYTKEEQELLEAAYLLGKELFSIGKYAETLIELEKIHAISDDYRNSKQLAEMAKAGLAQLEAQEKKRQEEIDKKIRDEKANELIGKAREAIEAKQMDLAEAYLNKVGETVPDHTEIGSLRLVIDSYRKEQARIAKEKAEKEAERKRQLDLLSPGKSFYLADDWYKAIIKLDEFLMIKNLDEDLIKEAAGMLEAAKGKLAALVDPLLREALSLKDGQDLKGSYEVFLSILNHDPSNAQALSEMSAIREILTERARRIYREAIIAESLTLHKEAKQKFHEVQQNSPIDSEYYKKATEKLKDYVD